MASTKQKTKVDYTQKGKPMSSQEFEHMVKEAEKGPFYPLETLKKDFAKWKKKRKK